MKFISWNVNGLRAVVGKGFAEIFASLDADFFCLQETKMQAGQLDLAFDGYESYWNYADKKGYSGTAIFTKHTPLSVTYGLGIDEHDHEGRVITLEMPDFYLVTCYTPNSQDGLRRLDYRMTWEDDFRAYLQRLDAKKPVIVCGDLNVAHKEIDLKNPKTNRKNAGFTDEEREKMIHRQFPLLLPRPHRCLFVVELPLPCAREECGVAYRLFPREQPPCRQNGFCHHSQRDFRQRPLPRRTRTQRLIAPTSP